MLLLLNILSFTLTEVITSESLCDLFYTNRDRESGKDVHILAGDTEYGLTHCMGDTASGTTPEMHCTCCFIIGGKLVVAYRWLAVYNTDP